MPGHDHFAVQEFIQRYWFHYDEGHLDVLRTFLADDCHLASRTELGTHPFESFIASDNVGIEAAMAWTKDTGSTVRIRCGTWRSTCGCAPNVVTRSTWSRTCSSRRSSR